MAGTVNETALSQEIEMNNANAIALIETGALPTEKMLELCEKATDNYGDDPRRPAVVRAFVRNWKSANPLASNQNLIDVVAACSKPVQAHTVYTIASEMSREDFEYGFRTLSCEGDLIFAAGASGKYTQDEVFAFGKRVHDNDVISFWSQVVDANVLDADGLHRVALLPYNPWYEMQKVRVAIIGKGMLNAQQMMDICKKCDRFEVSMAAIKTDFLSDDQILSLESTARSVSEDFWGSVIPFFHLEARTVSELVALGEKANSDKLWPSITNAINSKKAVRT